MIVYVSFVEVPHVSLEQYYTEEKIGERLVSLLPDLSPTRCVELSAGEGALLFPVIKKWPQIGVTTCELDSHNHAKLSQSFDGDHFHVDVMSSSFEDVAKTCECQFDLAVSNPPFSWRVNSDYEREVLRYFGLQFMESWRRVRSEVVFILQNLRLVRESGYIAIILPELIVRSSSFREFRRFLVKSYSICAVSEIEKGAFKGTEAKTYIVIIKKSLGYGGFKFYGSDGTEAEYAQELFGHTAENSYADFLGSQAQLLFDIKRGRHSGKELRSSGKPYYHTSGFSEPSALIGPTSLEFATFGGKRSVIARQGDVLIHRVGSRVLGKALIVENGSFLVSDCVFRVQVPDCINPYEVLRFWESHEAAVLAMARGTCAKYITKQDLMFILQQFVEQKMSKTSHVLISA